ncbi:MAG: spermidine synthase [Betaproteobacteria bacterium]|nr:spermidine synthase [Betaproteobacteria bacterium]
MELRKQRPPIAVSDAGGVRSLHIGGVAVQSAMRIDAPDALHLDYTRCMLACLLFDPQPQRALLVGLGGGSLAKFLHRNMKALQVRVVEVDRRVVDVARAHFALPRDDARLRVEVGEGTAALQPGCCDLLVVDAYEDERPARELAARGFYESAYAALGERGVMVLNLMSDDAALDLRVQAMEAAFGGAVLCMPALTDPNVLVFGLKGMPPRMPWRGLRERARALQARHGLPFPRYAKALRKMNAGTLRELIVHRDEG